MSSKPYSPVISSDRLWPALAAALDLTKDQQRRVTRLEIVLTPMAPIEITVTLAMLGDTKLESFDWPQFDPSQITIKEQG